MSDSSEEVLEGVKDVIDSHLFTDGKFREYQYSQKRTCIEFCENPPKSFDGVALVAAMYRRIEDNLHKRPIDRTPSQQNWRLRSTNDHDLKTPSDQNRSAEVKLERAIVEKWRGNWNYQMPIASGLFGEHSDKRRAIDLVFEHQTDHFELVELKIKSDTPLFAAMEILGYGLVYLASRIDGAGNLKYKAADLPVLRANKITLCVLAPAKYYGYRGSLSWLKDAINDGLKHLPLHNLAIDFRFEQFDFSWTSESTASDLPVTLIRKLVWQ
jgi:hypothetical protein